jgi:hypothetical protein
MPAKSAMNWTTAQRYVRLRSRSVWRLPSCNRAAMRSFNLACFAANIRNLCVQRVMAMLALSLPTRSNVSHAIFTGCQRPRAKEDRSVRRPRLPADESFVRSNRSSTFATPRLSGEPMSDFQEARRQFLKATGLAAGAIVLSPGESLVHLSARNPCIAQAAAAHDDSSAADYTLHIKESPIEIAPKRIISLKSYNGQFPGPLLRPSLLGSGDGGGGDVTSGIHLPRWRSTRKEVVRLGWGPNQIKTKKAGLNNSDGCRPPQPLFPIRIFPP